MVDKKIYNKAFYDENRKRNARSAEIIAPIVKKLCFENKTLLSMCDVGCGAGQWAKAFKNNGFEILGIDGNQYSSSLCISENEFVQHDFREPLNLNKKFDLVISLEVAEHLPSEMADKFVELLTTLSDIILFSAAIPHQLGQGHINEQWQSYWAGKFRGRGYEAIDCIRPLIWDNKEIWRFYKQNIILYIKKGTSEENDRLIERLGKAGEVQDVIHPEYWEHVNRWFPTRIVAAAYSNPFIYRIYQAIKKGKGLY